MSDGTRPAGRTKILEIEPHHRPEKVSSSPEPIVLARTPARRKRLRQAVSAAFRDAAEKLAEGDRLACFPRGTFPPGLPYVPPSAISWLTVSPSDGAGLERLELARDEAMSPSAERRRLRRGWAQLIRRICEVDPLLCPCGETTRILSFLTDPPVVRKTPQHLESQSSGRQNGSPQVGTEGKMTDTYPGVESWRATACISLWGMQESRSRVRRARCGGSPSFRDPRYRIRYYWLLPDLPIGFAFSDRSPHESLPRL